MSYTTYIDWMYFDKNNIHITFIYVVHLKIFTSWLEY